MDTVHVKSGTTRTDLGLIALREMCTVCARTENGAPVPCLGVVLTDGVSYNPATTAAEATATHDAGIIVISVGVAGALQSELQTIASGDGSANVFQVSQTTELADTVDAITEQACNQGQLFNRISNPTFFPFSKHVICFQESPAETMQCTLQ